MDKVRVLIIGAGPAGSTCGLLLRKRNIDCMLVDRAVFPRDKICGGGLTPRSYALLSRLLPTFRYDYNSVQRIKLLLDGRQVFDLQNIRELRIVKRREFDAQLLAEYKKSGGAFTNDALTAIEERDGQVIATFRSGRQIACEYLVGADGANSRVRKCLTQHLTPNTQHLTPTPHHPSPITRGDLLCMEQYGPKSPDNAIVINVSKSYVKGYYYSFPNADYDVQGFGDKKTTPQSFRQVLNDMGCPEEKARGAYIPNNCDYPLHRQFILIGDAGGFPNRLSSEGIYYAFLTAAHAVEAISTGRPFADINKKVFANKRKEEWAASFFYSNTGLTLLRVLCKICPPVVRWCYNRLTT